MKKAVIPAGVLRISPAIGPACEFDTHTVAAAHAYDRSAYAS